MANKEHLEILKQGVVAWNEWRKDVLILPDLSGANLNRNMTINGETILSISSEDDVIEWKRRGVDISDLRPGEFEIGPSRLEYINFSKTNLTDTNLSGAQLYRANISGSTLINAKLTKAFLNKADLSDSDLSGASLMMARLMDANFSSANLSNVDFRNTDLRNVNFYNANLSDADLFSAVLYGANLTSANLSNAKFDGAQVGETIFGNNDLTSAKSLGKILHAGPSILGIETVYKSKGNISEAFLRGVGVPESFITYMHSLTGQAFDFYSCFISYSNKDWAFVERLHADLQSKGVRCWVAPEDLRIGDKMRPVIDESIRIHDKLMIVLSEASVSSEWVEAEVEAALEREREQGRTVLFPIRIDDEVMQIKTGWPALIRRTRNIGDFIEWKTYTSYQQAFERLIRDLKANDSN